MTTQPTVMGRKLPRNDWEGDDRVLSNAGKFITCMDTAIGRAVSFATNGRTDEDGAVYRSALRPRDYDGIDLDQAKREVFTVAGLELVIIRAGVWRLANVKTHLRYARGLVVIGRYDALPREWRWQAGADFWHAMFVSHRSEATGNCRTWDALNPRLSGYGEWLPGEAIFDFMASANFECGYVPLQPL